MEAKKLVGWNIRRLRVERGLTIAYAAPNRLLLTVAGTRAQLDAAFGTQSVYGRAHGTVGYVNTTPLRLPATQLASSVYPPPLR